MNRVLLYRERKLIFVVVSMAAWLGMLGVFGPYLPANKLSASKQVVSQFSGNKVISHWIKKDGTWRFENISRLERVKRFEFRSLAAVSGNSVAGQHNRNYRLAKKNRQPVIAAKPSNSPDVTSSVSSLLSLKQRKRQMRTRLAEEIGRWARIGDRWEWRSPSPRKENSSRSEENVRNKEMTTVPGNRLAKTAGRENVSRMENGRWMLRDGIWIFEDAKGREMLVSI